MISVPERQQIQELVALYRLEPTIRDVYVEGLTDQSLLAWFLSELGHRVVSVKQIESVEVPVELVQSLGFENNNRGRVITLAHVLESELGRETRATTCVADSDFDRLLRKQYRSTLLLLTDYPSMELYFFESSSLRKFLAIVVRGFPKLPRVVMSEIQGPLVEMFLYRLANSRLGWGLRHISFETCCTLHKTGVVLDSDKYIVRLLNANNRSAQREAFLDSVRECRSFLREDSRNHMHGHDFIALLCWYIRQHKGYKGIGREIVERSIYACSTTELLAAEGMFRLLLQRVTP